jgi:hypothetical protein
MTKDDIARMARAAGFRAGSIELYDSDPMPFVAPASATDCMPELERFAALVAAAEREACANVCKNGWKSGVGAKYQGDVFAEAIKARGDK